MKLIPYLLVALSFLLNTTVFKGCEEEHDNSPMPDDEINSWTVYTPYNWTHDGQPYRSVYCNIYSDAASEDMKQQLGEIADDKFLQIMELFNSQDPSDFIYPPGYSKIDIYLNRNHAENINWAYWGGFIFTIRSSEISEEWAEYTDYTVGHELTHVYEFLIEGNEVLGTDVWFREGLAVHIGCRGSTIFKTITSLNELESWISENQDISGEGNPIKIHQHSDFPEGTEIHDYYRIFELATRYIVDINGMDRSFGDIKQIFYDIRKKDLFQAAFSVNLGIGLEAYETNFYDLLKTYLHSP